MSDGLSGRTPQTRRTLDELQLAAVILAVLLRSGAPMSPDAIAKGIAEAALVTDLTPSLARTVRLELEWGALPDGRRIFQSVGGGLWRPTKAIIDHLARPLAPPGGRAPVPTGPIANDQ